MNLKEHAHTINGVEGRMYARHKYADGRWSNQTWKASRKRGPITLTVTMRFDDTPRNNHETFAITADMRDSRVKHDGGWIAGGCMHEDIAKWFPELAPLIKWHLTSVDGSSHYIANTVYLAGDRDHNGLRKGELRQIRNGRTGELAWILEGLGTKYHDGPTPPGGPVVCEWKPWERVGEGKERQLEAARNVAVWPDATDEELCQEPEALKAALAARLPALLQAFRADMEACGFAWTEA